MVAMFNGRILLTALMFSLGLAACSTTAQEKQSEVSVDGGAVGYPIHQAVAE